jgi:hypothetical protein
VERKVGACRLVRGAGAVRLLDGDPLTEAGERLLERSPAAQVEQAQFPDFVDCCSPLADAETRMQSNASAEPVPTSPSASTANNTVRRRST